ncbi:hypothetical protein M758_12G156400 [Ceratodon purpureus]|nr:hypothetical protein M758_12G156400 [Ceratodon purpureus]
MRIVLNKAPLAVHLCFLSVANPHLCILTLAKCERSRSIVLNFLWRRRCFPVESWRKQRRGGRSAISIPLVAYTVIDFTVNAFLTNLQAFQRHHYLVNAVLSLGW